MNLIIYKIILSYLLFMHGELLALKIFLVFEKHIMFPPMILSAQ
jgi:hypothetical protein